MSEKDPRSGDAKVPGTREARLKAALKANIARRKAQARARDAKAPAAGPADPGDTTKG